MNTVVPILVYHSIAATATSRFRRWVVSPECFAEHLTYLRDNGYAPLTISHLVAAMTDDQTPFPARPILLTFDDGFADFYTNALPILQRYGFTATLYITTGYVGGTSRWLHREGEAGRPMLSWAQIREVYASGVECGSHTRSHPQLDTLPRSHAWDEIRGSKDELEQGLGQPVHSFAYPHGYFSSQTRRQVQDAGYTSACAVKRALSSFSDDRFALARLIVEADTEIEHLQQWLLGRNTRVAPFRESPWTRGWRLWRWSIAALKRGTPRHAIRGDA